MNSPDPRKVEVLKVWYSVFCTLMDADDYEPSVRLEKLFQLRDRLKQAYPELEQELAKVPQ